MFSTPSGLTGKLFVAEPGGEIFANLSLEGAGMLTGSNIFPQSCTWKGLQLDEEVLP